MKKHTEKKWTKKLKKVKIVAKNEEREFDEKNNNYGITLIALVITVVLNCCEAAMERMLKNVNILKI